MPEGFWRTYAAVLFCGAWLSVSRKMHEVFTAFSMEKVGYTMSGARAAVGCKSRALSVFLPRVKVSLPFQCFAGTEILSPWLRGCYLDTRLCLRIVGERCSV